MNNKSPRLASRPLRSLALATSLAALALGSCANESAPPRAAPRELVAANVSPPARVIIDSLFNDRAAMGETRALIVMRDGQAIYEAYADGFGPNSKLISWSMAKSITSVLIGMLVADGRLLLDEPAPVPDWQRPGDPRGNITLRHLLNMSSGLEHDEDSDPAWETDTVAMLFGTGSPNMAGQAEGKPPVAAPNELFNYSSSTSVILSDIIARALTDSAVPAVRRDAVRNFIDGRLAGPLGMTSLTPEFDASGTLIGGSVMHATARDYAKFGEFLRARGETPDGTRFLPESWMAFMLSSSPANPGYGGHIWLNRPQSGGGPGLWPDRGPADLFACLGHQGQYIIVSPREHMTVVRLGISTDAQNANVRDTLRRVMAAM